MDKNASYLAVPVYTIKRHQYHSLVPVTLGLNLKAWFQAQFALLNGPRNSWNSHLVWRLLSELSILLLGIILHFD